MTATYHYTSEIGALIYKGDDERELIQELAEYYGYTLSESDPDEGWAIDMIIQGDYYDHRYASRFWAALGAERDAPCREDSDADPLVNPE